MIVKRHWFWHEEYGDGVSAGWAMTAVAGVLVTIGLLSYWLNDMHMYHYGLFDMKR